MEIKNIIKNITPSITVMVIGLVGAYFVYNTYFSDRVASGVATYEPAAGEEMVVEDGAAATFATEDAAEAGAAAVGSEVAVEGEVVLQSADGVTFSSGEEVAPVEGEAAVEGAAEKTMEAPAEAPAKEGAAH